MFTTTILNLYSIFLKQSMDRLHSGETNAELNAPRRSSNDALITAPQFQYLQISNCFSCLMAVLSVYAFYHLIFFRFIQFSLDVNPHSLFVYINITIFVHLRIMNLI